MTMYCEITYTDLFDVIGHDIEMAGCFDRNYRPWEENVDEPELEDRGYQILDWTYGERDQFGPLSRVVRVVKNGVISRLVYG